MCKHNAFSVIFAGSCAGEQYTGKFIVFFDDNMLVKEREETDLEQREEQALMKERFVVYYQLKRNIREDK